jgi:predicted dehydrogenase
VNRKIKIGIIGTGGIAHAHMRAYQQFADVEIVGGADLIHGKARTFFDQYGLQSVPAFDSAAELIKNIAMDGVSINTYNTTHAEYSIMALEAGLHVQCEKPMSYTLQEAVDMVKAARKANRMLTIGFQTRYHYLRQKVDEMIGTGILGKIYYTQSGGGRRRGIPGGSFTEAAKAGFGCLGDIGCYSIDECLHALGYPRPLTVSAVATDHFGKNPRYWHDAAHFDVDDFSVAFVRLEDDLTYVFKQSWAMHANSLGDTLWLGTDGGLMVCNNLDQAGNSSPVVYYTDVNGHPTDSTINVNFNKPPRVMDDFTAKVRAYCDAIRDGLPAPIPGEEILVNQAICDGIYRSSKLKCEVEINIPPV